MHYPVVVLLRLVYKPASRVLPIFDQLLLLCVEGSFGLPETMTRVVYLLEGEGLIPELPQQ